MKTQSRLLALFAGGALLCAVSLSASADWFMKINSIPGDATTAGHEGWIKLESFSYGGPAGTIHALAVPQIREKAAKRATPKTCASVAGTGRLNITKQPGPSSTKLMAASATGTSLGDVIVDETASDGTTAMTYTLSDTLASSISVRGNSPRPDELITLTYSKITTKPAGCE